jgi:rRNA maturation endonuclease Nob1
MNKAMSKIAQINKEELSAQKVELASIKELDRLSQDVKEVTNFFEDTLQRAEKAKQDVKQSIKGRTQQSTDLLTAIRDVKNKAEELGVNVDVSKYENILNIYYKTADKVDAFLR